MEQDGSEEEDVEMDKQTSKVNQEDKTKEGDEPAVNTLNQLNVENLSLSTAMATNNLGVVGLGPTKQDHSVLWKKLQECKKVALINLIKLKKYKLRLSKY